MFVSSMESVESQTPLTLSPSNSGRRRSTDPNSPEFEFWMVRNPSFPTPNLLSADQLFNNGVLLPLQLLSLQQPDPPDLTPDPEQPEPAPESVPEPDSVSGVSTSKRWRDIFKMGEKKASEDKEKTKKKDRKSIGGAGGGGSGGAELNINIWPFSRSHSAGVGGTRPKVGGGGSRKVSSAPCSRSNSAGESKSRKWPNSPGRGGGIHLGRNSPVWQVRRAGSGLKLSESVSVKSSDKVVKKEGTETRKVKTSTTSRCGSAAVGGGGGGKGKGLSLNVPMCIGYRQQLSCRSDETSLVGGNGGGENGSGGAGKLFNLRTLFTTKKVY